MLRAHPRSRSRPVRNTSFRYIRPNHAIFGVSISLSVLFYALTFLTASPGSSSSRTGHSRPVGQQRGSVGKQQQQRSFISSEQTVCGGGLSTHLGFDYPQLRNLRRVLKYWCSKQQQQDLKSQLLLPWQDLTGAYEAALAAVQSGSSGSSSSSSDSSSSTSSSSSTRDLLSQLLQEGLKHIAAEQGSLQTCRHDHSLETAWQKAHLAVQSGSSSSSSSSSKRFLLAANFHNSAAVLPNFLLQVLRLALKLPQQQLAVGIYESGSSDTSRMWLTLLHQLLLPLGVPHNITLGGSLSLRQGLPRIQLLAALRNAALEPWLPPQQQQQQQQQQQRRQGQKLPRKAGVADVAESTNQGAAAAAAVAGSAELSFKGPAGGWVPDVIVYANDVFLCAEDLMRLALHDADVACGMDFYDAPWMDSPGEADNVTTASSSSSSSSSSDSSSSSSSGVLPGLQAEDDFFDPVTGRVVPISGMVIQVGGGNSSGSDGSSGSVGNRATSGSAGGGLRFYDKWVARDAAGHRLVNRPPFITHHQPSQAALSAGQPVPMTCCWNGLAVLAAKPFTEQGLRFRTSQPGECQGSECSLLCEDFARSGFRHVVMDPGVRLAYELDQVDALQGAAATVSAAAAAAGDRAGGSAVGSMRAAGPAAAAQGGSSGGVQPGLGPWAPWDKVSATSAALKRNATAATAAVAAAAKAGLHAPLFMECCDLQSGQSYVDFRRDCHMVNILAPNHTAEVLVPGRP